MLSMRDKLFEPQSCCALSAGFTADCVLLNKVWGTLHLERQPLNEHSLNCSAACQKDNRKSKVQEARRMHWPERLTVDADQ